MGKAKKDMIDAETFRKVKNMSMPEMNTFLYAIYNHGFNDGFSHLANKIREEFAIGVEGAVLHGTSNLKS